MTAAATTIIASFFGIWKYCQQQQQQAQRRFTGRMVLLRRGNLSQFNDSGISGRNSRATSAETQGRPPSLWTTNDENSRHGGRPFRESAPSICAASSSPPFSLLSHKTLIFPLSQEPFRRFRFFDEKEEREGERHAGFQAIRGWDVDGWHRSHVNIQEW